MGDKKNHEFATHKLNVNGFKKAVDIANAFDQLLNTLDSICMEGRTFSVAKTKLEEACFFAKKAMATNLDNQEVQGE